MELPRRTRGDELLPPGELTRLRERLRISARKHDLSSVIACAFDHRTRMLPFIFADTRMIPAGVRAIGSALADAGFARTRIVLQQWNRHFRPSQMRLDGRIPDLFMVSSMSLHSGPCMDLIRDAHRIDAAQRPLIIAGGPHAVYEPYDLFGADPARPGSADVVVTGEEFVLLSLIEVVLSMRARGESMRSAFFRARDSGALDDVPGLVYARGARDGVPAELVDTGIQRLVGDLDELPHPVHAYRLMEPPGRHATLSARRDAGRGRAQAQPHRLARADLRLQVRLPVLPDPRLQPAAAPREERRADRGRDVSPQQGVRPSLLLRRGRQLLQRQGAHARHRRDAGPRGIRRQEAARPGALVHRGDGPRHAADEGAPAARARGGLPALWLGVEDMTATLIKKGQSADKTTEAFRALARRRHLPDADDDAPRLAAALLARVELWPAEPDRALRRAGAVSMQILMLTPAAGSKLLEATYTSGQVFRSVGGRQVRPHMCDGNYVVASHHKRPWQKQLTMLAGYLYFYNPVWLVVALIRNRTPLVQEARVSCSSSA